MEPHRPRLHLGDDHRRPHQEAISGKEGDVVKAGRMGDIKIGADGSAVMGVPFVFDKTNIEQFAKMF